MKFAGHLEQKWPARTTSWNGILESRSVLHAPLGSHRLREIHVGHRVRRVLEVRNLIVGRPTRHTLDAREIDNRLVELNDHGLEKPGSPAVIHPGISSRRGRRRARRRRTIEDHVIFLIRVHGEIVEGTDAAQIERWTEPSVLRREQVLPRDVDVGIVGIVSDIRSYCPEVLTIDVHPRLAGCNGERVPKMMKWGLVPHWAKDDKLQYSTFNARAEEFTTKPAFRDAWKRDQRCLVVTDGFYEWKKLDAKGKLKQPHAIAMADDGQMVMAGLWAKWKSPTSGEEVLSCTILTSEPNNAMGELHDRMPVILAEIDWPKWLGEEPTSEQDLLALLRPCRDEDLKIWPVDKMVGNVKNNGSQLILPVPSNAVPA